MPLFSMLTTNWKTFPAIAMRIQSTHPYFRIQHITPYNIPGDWFSFTQLFLLQVQGTTYFINNNPEYIENQSTEEETVCNKDTSGLLV